MSHTRKKKSSRSPRSAAVLAAGVLLLVVTVIWLPACEMRTSFRGPGYDRAKGVTLPDAPQRVVVALTYATLDRATRGPFDSHSVGIVKRMDEHPGLIGYSVRVQFFGDEIWTMSVWRDHESVDAFVASRIHQDAIDNGMPAVRVAKFHRFEVPAESIPPSWAEIERILAELPAKDYEVRE